MFLKRFLIEELRKISGGTEEEVLTVSKKLLVYLGYYLVLMLLTCGMGALSAKHLDFIAVLFGFLFMIEQLIISLIFSALIFCVSLYYGAYFARKGWDRYSE